MTDKELKRQITKIIAGSVKSTIHDHPEYLSDDKKYIIRRALGSIAKRASGHILRLLRASEVEFRSEDFEGMPPMKKLPPITGRTLPLKKLEFVDWGAESDRQTQELVASTRDIRERAEQKMADKMIEAMKTDVPEELERRSTLNGKPRC